MIRKENGKSTDTERNGSVGGMSVTRGEVIGEEEYNRRLARGKNEKHTKFYLLLLEKYLYLDALKYGNKARFINNSCGSNVQAEKWIVCVK